MKNKVIDVICQTGYIDRDIVRSAVQADGFRQQLSSHLPIPAMPDLAEAERRAFQARVKWYEDNPRPMEPKMRSYCDKMIALYGADAHQFLPW